MITEDIEELLDADEPIIERHELWPEDLFDEDALIPPTTDTDRKSTRLNSSH